jgi:spore germination protein KA
MKPRMKLRMKPRDRQESNPVITKELTDLLPGRREQSVPLTGDLAEIQRRLTHSLRHTADFKAEPIRLGSVPGTVFYLWTMCDLMLLNERVLQPVTQATVHEEEVPENVKTAAKALFAGTLQEWIHTEQDVLLKLLSGYAVFMVEGMTEAAAVFVQTSSHRNIAEPSTQTIVKGPKDAFIEDLTVNMSLLRKRVRNPALRFEIHTLGTETGTDVSMAYIEGIANTAIVEEIRRRLLRVRLGAVLESSNIEECIVDKTLTPFPLAYNTERPDTIAAHLINGKVAVIVDGTPFVLTVPSTFADFNSSAEDFYQSFMMGSFLRMLRYFSFMLSLLLPAIYVAVITFHHELIPTPLLISVIAQREGVPFPAVVEAFIMEITFEILREAGVRMPRAVGGTISIVGGLVIGQAAVEAGIISNAMVIIVALTAISNFVSPVYNFSVASRLLRFVFMILAGSFGLYGVLLGLIAMVGHLCSLRSFGVPYMAPIAPFTLRDQKDVFVRLPVWFMEDRPKAMRSESPMKQPSADSPSPPPLEEGKEPSR